MKFTIPGPPKGKARHRTSNGHAYTPTDTLMYENAVGFYYLNAGGEMMEGQFELTIWAYYPIPKNTSKKRRTLMLEGKIRPTIKPDFDNVGKIVADSLNKIAYRDDACVTDATVRKRYSDNPRVEIILKKVEA